MVACYVDTLGRGEKLFPFTKRQLARLFQFYAGKAKLDRSVHPYALRHTVGMRLWRHTRDLRIIQAVMGHVHLKATAAYVHVEPERMRAAYNTIGTLV